MTREQLESWWGRLEQVKWAEGLDTKEREMVRAVLQREVMVKALGLLLHNIPDFAASLLKADLVSPEGIKAAIRLQSQAAGISHAVRLLGEMVLEEKGEQA